MDDELIEAMALVLFNRLRQRLSMRMVDHIGANDTHACNDCREQARAALAVVREHDKDGERYRYIKAHLRRLDIAGLCITDANAGQLDARIDAARGEGMSDFNHIWLDRPYNELTDEQLKAVADWHQRWRNTDQHRACVHMMALRTQLAAERERVARLVGAIHFAPHAETCTARYTDIVGGMKVIGDFSPVRSVERPCNCWKRTALEGK